MKRKLDKGKIYIKIGVYFSVNPTHEMDSIQICYAGEGEAKIPQSLIRKMYVDNGYAQKLLKNPVMLLFEAVKHSQYITFENLK